MSYDPEAIRETILIWKSNYKIIKATLAYLFFSVLLVWHGINCLSKKQDFFFFFFKAYSEPRVLKWGQSHISSKDIWVSNVENSAQWMTILNGNEIE